MMMPMSKIYTVLNCPWTPGVQACLWVPCLEDMTTAISRLDIHGPVNDTEDASLQPARGPLNVNLLSPQNMDQEASEQTQHRGEQNRAKVSS